MSSAVPARLVAALLMLTATPARAADAPERKGFWIAFGAGYGSAQAECDQCVSEGRVGSFNGTLRLGGTLGSHWLLGWESSGWLQNNSTSWLSDAYAPGRTLGTSTVVALYYPSSSAGFFVKGGLGLSYAGLPPRTFCDVGDFCELDSGANGVGFGVTGGLGYDVRIGRRMSLTPEISFALGLSRDLSDGGAAAVTGWSHDVWAVNLCLTFH